METCLVAFLICSTRGSSRCRGLKFSLTFDFEVEARYKWYCPKGQHR